LKTLQNLFDSVLTDVTKGMQEEDLVQVTLECPDVSIEIVLSSKTFLAYSTGKGIVVFV
jgi:hypothetical protein